MKHFNFQIDRVHLDGVILKKLAIDNKYVNKQRLTFYTSKDVCKRCREQKILLRSWCLYFCEMAASFLSKNVVIKLSLGKPIDSYWFKISCLHCLVLICVHCFFLKILKLYKDICSAWISSISTEIFFLIDWRHRGLKNAIDLLLFYREHFYGFLESELRKIKCCR